jgi:alkanesulfonate monooxygenase SsuD/methylene tetrahydromethanopterin reductase-like flavin-dependent oxidoreductase (luciferase family)
LAFCLGSSPAPWGRAQQEGDREALAKAVDWTIELARMADAAGIESFWVMEDPDGWDALAVLGAMARQTEHIRLGTGVINAYYRHPSLIAASMATLDLLSQGRAFLGFGRGQSEWYKIAMGMDVGKPTRRMTETIELLRQWWSPELRATSPDDATEFAIHEWERVFRPIQSAFPIYMASVGPVAMRTAARYADGVVFNDLASMQFMRESIASVREEAERAGRDASGFMFAARSQVIVTDDPERVYEQRKGTVAMIHALPGMERLMTTDGYDIGQIVADVRKVMNTDEILAKGGGFGDLRRGGDLPAAKKIIPTSLMEQLVIAGPLPLVRERLRQLREIGVTDVFLATPPAGTTADELGGLVASLR